MQRKSIVAFLIGLSLGALVAVADAAPVKVCVTDEGGHTKCVQAKPATEPSLAKLDLAKVKRLSNEAARLRKAIEEVQGNDVSRVEQFVTDVQKLRKQVDDLLNNMKVVNSALPGVTIDATTALRNGKLLELSLGLLALDIKKLQRNVAMLARFAHKLDLRKTNLEVSALGYATTPLGVGAGAAVTLALPMGDESLWTTRLTGSLGVSPSAALGWLAEISITRKIGRHFSVGPAGIALGDAGDLIDKTSRGWILGGGAELRISHHNFFLAVTPFIGVAVRDETYGVGWHNAEYKCIPCGYATAREAGYDSYVTEPHKRLAGGAIFAVGASLF
ncbi:MAG: hypothetical protein V1661_00090 [bacterium]